MHLPCQDLYDVIINTKQGLEEKAVSSCSCQRLQHAPTHGICVSSCFGDDSIVFVCEFVLRALYLFCVASTRLTNKVVVVKVVQVLGLAHCIIPERRVLYVLLRVQAWAAFQLQPFSCT